MKNWKSIGCVVVILVAFAAIPIGLGLSFSVLLSPPRAETVHQPKPDSRPFVPVKQPLDELRQDWDSEAPFTWAATPILAQLSREAYLPSGDAVTAFQSIGFEDCHTIAHGSMWASVISRDDLTVVVFRGTDDNADWQVNLDVATVTTRHGAVHQGFWNAYKSMAVEIVALVAKRKPKVLWTTGHSLGGALAVVCAWDLEENHQCPIHGVATFGQPMVAKAALAKHLETLFRGRYARFVNRTDIVPRIPPRFTDVGSLVWFNETGIRRSPPIGFAAAQPDQPTAVQPDQPAVEVQPLSDQQFREFKRAVLATDRKPSRTPEGEVIYEGDTPYILDHAIEDYMEAIAKELPHE